MSNGIIWLLYENFAANKSHFCAKCRSHAAVGPDARIKSWPKFSKSCTKSSQSIFTPKVQFFKLARKVAKYLDYFGNKICHQELIFKDRQIWSHCSHGLLFDIIFFNFHLVSNTKRNFSHSWKIHLFSQARGGCRKT